VRLVRDRQAIERSIATPTGPLVFHVTGQGQPVLLVAGIGGGAQVFARQAEHLAQRFRVVSWDLRGLGLDDVGPHRGLGDHADDALEILSALDVLRVPVIAWSTGVPIALELLRRAPERVGALVMICGVVGRPFPLRLFRPSLTAAMPLAARALTRLPAFGTRLAKRAVQWPETMSWAKRLSLIGATFDEEIYTDAVQHLASLDLSRVAALLHELSEHDGRTLLEMIYVPTLLIAGERDAFVPPRVVHDVARRIRDAEVLTVPGGTHYALVEQPEFVNLRIDKFFAERRYEQTAARVSS
jgi:pimeloyl-ACP methyl ester carboxylesterase